MRNLLLSARKTQTVETRDLGNGYAVRVLDIPGIGSYNLVDGQGGPGNKVYSSSPWAFACMQIRGSELANLPWRLVNRETGVVIERHPLIDMLVQFGQESNYAESMQATEIDLLMYGKAFWFRDADLLERLSANTVKVISNASGIQGFEQWVRGKKVNDFARDEIVYFREHNPSQDLAPGVPVMEVVKRDISIEVESALYLEAFFKNDATPSLLLSSEQPVAEPEMTKVMAWWNQTFKGSKKAHKTAFADRGLKAQVLASTIKENAVTAIHDQAVNSICVGFRVPRLLAGQFVEATYANANEARIYLLENVVVPRSTYIADVIDADLTRKIDPAVKLQFVPQDLAILQESATSKVDRLSKAKADGVISDAFYRSQMGWPETAAPAAPPTVAETPAERAIISWARKAKKALRAGQGANVPFETDDLSPTAQAAIRARLGQATTEPEVERAFRDD